MLCGIGFFFYACAFYSIQQLGKLNTPRHFHLANFHPDSSVVSIGPDIMNIQMRDSFIDRVPMSSNNGIACVMEYLCYRPICALAVLTSFQ